MRARNLVITFGLVVGLASAVHGQSPVPPEDDPRRPQAPPGVSTERGAVSTVLGAPWRFLDRRYYNYARRFEERCGSVAAGLAATRTCRAPQYRSIAFGSLGSKSGFWGLRLGLHTNLAEPSGFRTGVSAAGTWRAYQRYEAFAGWNDPARAPYVRTLGFYDLDTRNAFFGIGRDSNESDESDYSWERFGVEAETGVPARVGLWGHAGVRYEKSFAYAGRNPDEINTEVVFPDVPGVSSPQQELWGPYAEVVLDITDAPLHPTRGVKVKARGALWRSVDDQSFNWRAYGGEVQGHLPLGSHWHVFSVLAGFDQVEPEDSDDTIPFMYLPYLGGSTRLRGYETWRFVDRTAAYGTAEYRYRIWQESAPDLARASAIETAIFYDVGDVGDELEDIDLFEKNSYGFEFRLYIARRHSFRFGVARSEEGTRLNFRFTDVY